MRSHTEDLRSGEPARLETLALIGAEVERLDGAGLVGLANHLRGLADLIEKRHISVSKLDDRGITFEVTELGVQSGVSEFLPSPGDPAEPRTVTIEEVRGEV